MRNLLLLLILCLNSFFTIQAQNGYTEENTPSAYFQSVFPKTDLYDLKEGDLFFNTGALAFYEYKKNRKNKVISHLPTERLQGVLEFVRIENKHDYCSTHDCFRDFIVFKKDNKLYDYSPPGMAKLNVEEDFSINFILYKKDYDIAQKILVGKTFYLYDKSKLYYKKIKITSILQPTSVAYKVLYIDDNGKEDKFDTYFSGTTKNEYKYFIYNQLLTEEEYKPIEVTAKIAFERQQKELDEKQKKDTMVYFGSLNNGTYLRIKTENGFTSSDYFINKDMSAAIAGYEEDITAKHASEDTKYFKVYTASIKDIKGDYELRSGYIIAKYIDFKSEEEKNKALSSINNKHKNKIADSLNSEIYSNVKKKLSEKYYDYDKKGLVIIDYDYIYQEYSSLFGLKLSIYNGYKKTIKYIDITYQSYNRVCDLIKDDFGKSRTTAKGIGPMEYGKVFSIPSDNLFMDSRDVINRIKVTYLKVTFTDGTVKEIKNINDHLGEETSFECTSP